MTLEELLQDVDLLVPNSIALDVKVRFMNQVQNQLFRDYDVSKSSYVFTLIPGEELYPLPEDCPEDMIRSVVVEGRTYELANTEDSITDETYFVHSGLLTIIPSPQKEGKGMVHYLRRPRKINEYVLEREPDFPRDYHELLSYGCAIRVARIEQDYEQLSVLEGEFQRMRQEADINLTSAKQRNVTITRSFY